MMKSTKLQNMAKIMARKRFSYAAAAPVGGIYYERRKFSSTAKKNSHTRTIIPHFTSLRQRGHRNSAGGVCTPRTFLSPSSSNNSSTESSSPQFSPSLSPSSLNIIPTISNDLIQSISQLPEVDTALKHMTNTKTDTENTTDTESSAWISELQRACDIFQQFGSQDHYDAVSLLQVQALFDQINGHYPKQLQQTEKTSCSYSQISEILNRIRQQYHDDVDDDKNDQIQLLSIIQLQAKVDWYHGNFESALRFSQEASALAPQVGTNDHSDSTSLKQVCSWNGMALSKLASANVLDYNVVSKLYDSDDKKNIDGKDERSRMMTLMEETREAQKLLQMASSTMTNEYEICKSKDADGSIMVSNLALAAASSYSNLGIAEFIGLLMKSTMSGRGGTVGDIGQAMKTWRKALDILDNCKLSSNRKNTTKYQEALEKNIEARLYCNMAWTILYNSTTTKEKIQQEDLKIASEYSGLALKIYTDLLANYQQTHTGTVAIKQSMGRALSLVAICYAKAGSAVTAEGLFQSAIDALSMSKYQQGTDTDISNDENPLTMIDARTCFMGYSDLCSNWEKRDSDSKKSLKIASGIDESLIVNWQSKSGIYSGLWFFSAGDFQ